MNFQQRKLIMNSFITSHFSYCSVVWMFHSRKSNNHINRIHERALRIVYKDYDSSFKELLLKDESFSIHQRKLQKLMIEIFKVKIGIAPTIMNNVFEIVELPCNLRKDINFKSKTIRTTKYGRETASNIGALLWEKIPDNIKAITNLEAFKSKIKNWIPKNCPCRLCKTYIPNLGFI